MPNAAHRKYPYLLKELEINRPDQAWCADITCIPMERGTSDLMPTGIPTGNGNAQEQKVFGHYFPSAKP